LIEHFAVLAGATDDRGDFLLATLAFQDQGAHFDGFGPGSEDDQGPQGRMGTVG
jgi:hypothetical protein